MERTDFKPFLILESKKDLGTRRPIIRTPHTLMTGVWIIFLLYELFFVVPVAPSGPQGIHETPPSGRVGCQFFYFVHVLAASLASSKFSWGTHICEHPEGSNPVQSFRRLQ
jgi:hypothetical protein